MTDRHANPEDLDLFALGALDGQEEQAVEAHVRGCATCRQELVAAQKRVSLLGASAPPVAPRPQVKLALMQQVKAERATRKAVPEVKPKKIRWGLRFSLGFGLATALLGFAAFELAKMDLDRGNEIKDLQAKLDSANKQIGQDSDQLAAMSQVTAAPDSTVIALLQQPGGPPGQAHVMFNARLGLAVYSGQLAPPPADKSYQLWLVPASGAPVDAGVVSANQQSGAVVARLTPGLSAKAFAVTLEPLGGRPQPTGPKVLVGAVS